MISFGVTAKLIRVFFSHMQIVGFLTPGLISNLKPIFLQRGLGLFDKSSSKASSPEDSQNPFQASFCHPLVLHPRFSSAYLSKILKLNSASEQAGSLTKLSPLKTDFFLMQFTCKKQIKLSLTFFPAEQIIFLFIFP